VPKGPPLPRRPSRQRLVAFSFAVAAAALLFAELALRFSRRYATATELSGQDFSSPHDLSRFRIPWIGFDDGVNTEHRIESREFSFDVRTNSLGIRDDEHPLQKAAGELRIAALGDSFVASHGVEWRDGWTEQLERRLREERAADGGTVRVISGGIPGHDPVFSLHLYRLRLRALHPDLVLLLVNASDVHDVAIRGGLDRFDAEGRIHKGGLTWAERISHRSHLARALLISAQGGGDARRTLVRVTPAEREQAAGQIVRAASELRDLVRDDGARFLMLLHPHAEELRDPRSAVLRGLATRARAAGIPLADLLPEFRTRIPPADVDRYFFAADGHCTKEGYAVFADAVHTALRRARLLAGRCRTPDRASRNATEPAQGETPQEYLAYFKGFRRRDGEGPAREATEWGFAAPC
jgi:lysophospholipase L1-like esterase